jgi:membrane protease YdiL (CAAX protease family)
VIGKLRERLKPWLAGLGDEAAIVIIASSAVLVISHYQGATGYFRTVFGDRFDKHPAVNAMAYGWWFFMSLVLYMIVPLILSFGARLSFYRKYGLGLGDWRAGLKVSLLFLAVMLPAAFIASKTKAFANAYPLAGSNAYTLTKDGKQTVSVGLFLLYELGYISYFIGWEFLFRGWMINGLLKRFGRAGAILIPVAPFAVMHVGKAEPEALGSIVACIALGILALRTRSFWYGFAVHCAVAVWMDILYSWQALSGGA